MAKSVKVETLYYLDAFGSPVQLKDRGRKSITG